MDIPLDNKVLVEQRKKILSDLMSTASGRIFCGMLIEGSGFFANSYLNSNVASTPEPNTMQMCFNNGKQFMGEMVYSMLLSLGKEHEFPWQCLREHDKWVSDMRILSEARAKTENDYK